MTCNVAVHVFKTVQTADFKNLDWYQISGSLTEIMIEKFLERP